MDAGQLLPVCPIIFALGVWWWRLGRNDRFGGTLGVFLLGYLLLLSYQGWYKFAAQLAHSSEPSSVLWFLVGATLASYFLGGVGIAFLMMICEMGKIALFGLDEIRLTLSMDKATLDQRGMRLDASGPVEESADEQRRRAIEECAEQAYEFLVQRGIYVAFDRDRAEGLAAELRDSLLELGMDGRNYAG